MIWWNSLASQFVLEACATLSSHDDWPDAVTAMHPETRKAALPLRAPPWRTHETSTLNLHVSMVRSGQVYSGPTRRSRQACCGKHRATHLAHRTHHPRSQVCHASSLPHVHCKPHRTAAKALQRHRRYQYPQRHRRDPNPFRCTDSASAPADSLRRPWS